MCFYVNLFCAPPWDHKDASEGTSEVLLKKTLYRTPIPYASEIYLMKIIGLV